MTKEIGENGCCICESGDSRHYKSVEEDGRRYNLLQCRGCGLVYLDRSSSVQITDFIVDAKKDLNSDRKQKVEYWSFPEQFGRHRDVFEKFFEERLERARKHNGKIESILDVGCGYGFWMDYCRERGISTKGIDINPDVIDYAKEKLGLHARLQDFADYSGNEKYDMIMMFDIIEHLNNPNDALRKSRGLLNKDGLLYLQVPNVLGFKIPPNHGYGFPYHLWQFSFSTLEKLLNKNDYSVVGHWTGPMGVIKEYEKRYKEGNRSLFLKEIMWKVAGSIGLGNRLQIIAKDKSHLS